jgi:SAM-dependent methyltransferase
MKFSSRKVVPGEIVGTESMEPGGSAVTESTSSGPERSHYIIRGGVAGRERLRVLARVMRPTTLTLFDRVGIKPGMVALDVGCGGGDVTFDLARLVGSEGKSVGWDIDETKLELARREGEQRKHRNLEFRRIDIGESDRASAAAAEFDVIYARFLLSHLGDPSGALARMLRVLKPGGLVILEDTDFTGSFCHPPCAAFRRFVDLYTQTVQRRGGEPNIGPRLPAMLLDAGVERAQMNVVQPAALEGEVKLLYPLTMENVVEAVLAEKLASKAELEKIIAELYQFARDPRTVVGTPRNVEAWGYRPQVS